NVRELEHAVESAAVRARGETVIRCRDLPPAIAGRVLGRDGDRVRDAGPGDLGLDPGEVPSEAELRRLLVEPAGHVLHVAAALGRDRRQLYRWLERYGIDIAAIRREHRARD